MPNEARGCLGVDDLFMLSKSLQWREDEFSQKRCYEAGVAAEDKAPASPSVTGDVRLSKCRVDGSSSGRSGGLERFEVVAGACVIGEVGLRWCN